MITEDYANSLRKFIEEMNLKKGHKTGMIMSRNFPGVPIYQESEEDADAKVWLYDRLGTIRETFLSNYETFYDFLQWYFLTYNNIDMIEETVINEQELKLRALGYALQTPTIGYAIDGFKPSAMGPDSVLETTEKYLNWLTKQSEA